MIAIVSSSHFPDDERIYHKQIHSLLDVGKNITYYTRSISSINLSKRRLIHINYDQKISIKKFTHNVAVEILNHKLIDQVQIHETELLPLLKIIKQKMISTKTWKLCIGPFLREVILLESWQL